MPARVGGNDKCSTEPAKAKSVDSIRSRSLAPVSCRLAGQTFRRYTTFAVKTKSHFRAASAFRALCLFVSLFSPMNAARATTKPELVPEQAGIDQHLDAQLDLSANFTSAGGTTKPLGEYLIPGRPTIIVPVYFECPRLCGYTMNGVVKLLDELDFELGKDYKVLSISIDPKETALQAAERASEFRAKLKNPERGNGWDFLVGQPDAVRSIMSQLGFKFAADGKEFSHAAGIMVLTPNGKISRYFFGIEYPSTEARYTLVEASQGRIGGIIDHVFLYCFRFDPTKGKYSILVWNVTRAVCIAFTVLLAGMLILLRMKENAG